MNKTVFLMCLALLCFATPVHAFKKAGESASPAPAAAQPAPVASPVKPAALPTAAPAAPVVGKKVVPVKPVAEKEKPVVTLKERHSANGATAVRGEVDIGQAIRNAFKGDASAKSEGNASPDKKSGKSAAAKAQPETKEEGVADKVTQKFGSWWERVKKENKACELNPADCSWSNE